MTKPLFMDYAYSSQAPGESEASPLQTLAGDTEYFEALGRGTTDVTYWLFMANQIGDWCLVRKDTGLLEV